MNHVRRGQGEPLLLLHSLGGSLIQWSPVIDRLAAEREVVALDMPGFGRSVSLPEGIEPSAANLATAVLDFADSLGFDGVRRLPGSRSAAGRRSSAPAREGCARRSPSARPASGSARRSRPTAPWPGRGGPAGRSGRCSARWSWTGRGRRLALGGVIRHPERLSAGEATSVAKAYVTAPGYPEASALMRAGRVEDLKGVKVPITLAWAEHDTLVRTKPLKPGILPKRVKQVELPGCGHVPTWDNPDLVARVVLEGTKRKR